MMFCVYILHSQKLNRFYIGTTDDFEKRLAEHNSAINPDAFTTKGVPWASFLIIDKLTSAQAYAIEKHVKKHEILLLRGALQIVKQDEPNKGFYSLAAQLLRGFSLYGSRWSLDVR